MGDGKGCPAINSKGDDNQNDKYKTLLDCSWTVAKQDPGTMSRYNYQTITAIVHQHSCNPVTETKEWLWLVERFKSP